MSDIAVTTDAPKDTEKQLVCFNCKQVGHKARFCPELFPQKKKVRFTRRRSDLRNNRVKRCYICHEEGHLARACPKKTAENTESKTAVEAPEPVEPQPVKSEEPAPAKPATEEKLCYICHKPGHTARNCFLRRRFVKGCYHCLQEGHLARDCPNQIVCSRCEQEGHKSRDCPNEPICYKCKKPGHKSKECTNPIVCNKCGQPGHKRTECTA